MIQEVIGERDIKVSLPIYLYPYIYIYNNNIIMYFYLCHYQHTLIPFSFFSPYLQNKYTKEERKEMKEDTPGAVNLEILPPP